MSQETPEPQSGAFTWDDIQKEINRVRDEAAKERQEQEERHVIEMDAVRRSVAGIVPISAVPEHAGGPGLEIRPTWSLAEQEAARTAAHA